MELEATFDYVILTPFEKQTKKGEIYLPDRCQGESDFCEVVSVGPDTVTFSVGNVVLRPNPALYEYTDESDGVLYLLVKESEIAARVVN